MQWIKMLFTVFTVCCFVAGQPDTAAAKCKLKVAGENNRFGLPPGVMHTSMKALFVGGRGQFVNSVLWRHGEQYRLWILLNKKNHLIKSQGTQDTKGPIWIDPTTPLVFDLPDGTQIKVHVPVTSLQAKKTWRFLEGIDLRLVVEYSIAVEDLRRLAAVPVQGFRIYYRSEHRIDDTTFDDIGNFFEWKVRPIHARQLRDRAACMVP